MDVDIDIEIDIRGDMMFPFRHWMKHMAMVPKGFLRYKVLRLLDEKPMSGSEIMVEIERQTEGRWKPSPGSIYPLLSWLQDKGYIKEAAEQEAGIKRYALTDKARASCKNTLRNVMKYANASNTLDPDQDLWDQCGLNSTPKGRRNCEEPQEISLLLCGISVTS